MLGRAAVVLVGDDHRDDYPIGVLENFLESIRVSSLRR